MEDIEGTFTIKTNPSGGTKLVAVIALLNNSQASGSS